MPSPIIFYIHLYIINVTKSGMYFLKEKEEKINGFRWN